MDYAAYIKEVQNRASIPGAEPDIYFGALLDANVVSALTGSGISGVAKNYYPLFKGNFTDPGVIDEIMGIPGIEAIMPTMPSGSWGRVKAGALMPGNYRKPFSYKYAAPYGTDYQKFMAQLISLYNDRLFSLGILNAAEQFKINTALNAGYIIMPITSNVRGDVWNEAVKPFKAAQVLYNEGLVKEGYAELEKSRKNLAFWSALKSTLEVVAAPITAVTEVAKFGWDYKKPLMYAGLAVAAYIVYNKVSKGAKTAKGLLS
jgi:hypothetical protein